ncbi:hypothetical protein COO60DRAFT_1483401 [Scenedesmus sp. NREL 46B-D3]|nr:hypothetical protein COO60DRAFT_1483401 [Scenedesmus sp. NREL 46B-D3]
MFAEIRSLPGCAEKLRSVLSMADSSIKVLRFVSDDIWGSSGRCLMVSPCIAAFLVKSWDVNVRAGWWIDAIQFKYGTTTTPWRGDSGSARPSLDLAPNEWISQAWVVSGGYVDEICFITNRGRYWSTIDDASNPSHPDLVMASPCPANAHRWAFASAMAPR